MKKLNYEELKIVNGGAAEKTAKKDWGTISVTFKKDDVTLLMTIEDLDWLMCRYGRDLIVTVPGREIERVLARHHGMVA